jgi:acyl dehydratase
MTTSSLPSVWPSYARALASRRPALAPAGSAISAERRVSGLAVPAAALAAYRRVCRFAEDGHLPLTYPHVLANPLHLALLTGPDCPVRLLGLVHLRNTVRSLRPLAEGERLDLRCALSGPRETERGQELDLVTEVHAGGELAWTETSVVLARRSGAGRAGKAPAPVASLEGEGTPLRWEVPAGQGRRYAAASGDWNPIHLAPLTARFFGFERAIVHGMWTLGRVAAELRPRVPGRAVELEAAFKLPVYLPAVVTLRLRPVPGGLAFTVRDGDGMKPHVVGKITAT